jgi:peptide/nickel transport system substrate-binding protein
MQRTFSLAITALVLLGFLLVACSPAAPTMAPTKPTAQAPVTSAPVAAATTAPAAATKPAAVPATAVPAPTAATKIKRGGTVRYAEQSPYNTLDAILGSAASPAAGRLLFDSLFASEQDQKTGEWKVIPELATVWEWKDTKTLNLTLRKGVKFHDGSDFNADTAIFSILRARDHPKSYGKTYVSYVTSVDKIDDYAIRINLKSPYAPTLAFLSASIWSTVMQPKGAVEKMGDDAYGAKPVGSGPFQFVEWVRDDHITLKKADTHWQMGVDGKPLPYIDQWVSKQVTDPAVSLLEVRAGNLEALTELDDKDVAAVKANPDLVYLPSPWSGSFYFTHGFNQKTGAFSNNVKLRQAYQYAIDRESMAKALGFGIAKAHSQPYWSAGMVGFDDSLPKYTYDPAKAKALVAEAGFPNGVETTLTFINRPSDQRVAEMAKQMLDTVGIKTTLDAFDRTAWIDRVKNMNFQTCFWRPLNAHWDPDWATFEVTTGSAGNWSGFSEPELDQCMADARSEMDPVKRGEVYKKCQKIIYETARVGTAYHDPRNVVHRKYMQGLKLQFYTRDFREVWLDK